MVTTDVTKLIDGLDYLLQVEQLEQLHAQMDLLIPLLIEQKEADTLITLLKRILPALLERQQSSHVARYLQLVEPYVSTKDSERYALLSLLYGHTYFVIEEIDKAVHYYQEALSYFMHAEPINFRLMSSALLNLSSLTEQKLSPAQQLSYARVISIFSTMQQQQEKAEDIVHRYAVYYETCLNLQRFEEAKSILQKMKNAGCPPYCREELQIYAFEVLFYYRQHDYEQTLHYGDVLLSRFSKQKNMTVLSYIYTILIESAEQVQQTAKAASLRAEKAALEKTLQLKRNELHAQLPVKPFDTLPNSTPLSCIAETVNNTLKAKSYTLLIYDISNTAVTEDDSLAALHASQLPLLRPYVTVFTALKSTQLLYVLEGDDEVIAAAIEQTRAASLDFTPVVGYCHASAYTFTTFEQLLQMTYAHIYYAYSKQYKLS